jgi:tetratricopeptide (TPR) repeat protein
VTNLSRTTKALWNIANQNGLPSVNIGWWPSHPAEPLSRGVMVSNHYQRASGPEDNWPMMAGTVHPPRLAQLLAGLRFHPNELDAEAIGAFLPALAQCSNEELAALEKDPRVLPLAKILAETTSVQSAATALIQNEPWGLFCVYYDAIDHFGHGFMRYHPPRQPQVSEADFGLFKDVVEAGYRYQDMQLGALLALAGDDTLVILCSDHGFHPDHLRPRHIPVEPAGPAAEHRPFGIFAARGPGLRRDAVIHGASLLDLAPTVLHYLGLPVGEDMEGKVLLDIYDETAGPIPEVRRIPSWDLVEGDAGLHPAERQIAPEESKAALDQLVALGYIDAPGADQAAALEQTVRELDYNKAQSLLDGGRSAQAAEIFERLYARWPDEHRFGVKLSTCYRNLKRGDDLRRVVGEIRERRLASAREAVEAIQAQGLDSPEALARVRAEIAELPEAEAKARSKEVEGLLVRARPNLVALRFLEASAALADGDLDQALALLGEIEGGEAERPTEDGPAAARRRLPVNALLLRGEVRLRRRDYREALADFELVNDYDDEHPVARLGLARACLGLGRYDDAARWALGSIALVFNQPWAHYLHGVALLRAGRWREAEPVFELAARFQGMAPAAYRMLLGIARRERNDLVLTARWLQAFRAARQRNRDERSRHRALAAETHV